MYRFVSVIIILTALVIFAPIWFPIAMLTPLFVVHDLPSGIYGRKALEQNFEANRTALETVVSETQIMKVSLAKRGHWTLGGYRRSDPQGDLYGALYGAMQQAKVQSTEVALQTPLVIVLVTDERSRMIDTDRYGYAWVENREAALARDYQGLYGGYWLDEHWYLFEQLE